jgi:diaminohydroxyphosphoribosylaminopyrimidine deaminase/5-amino-6-(5-phosphoribosylamino)uracil reductase
VLTAPEDFRFMARALQLARQGLYTTDPNPRVGCVLVKGGRIVGQGHHERAGQAHAEINALRSAGPRARGASAYVTLEPCCHHGKTAPCTQALIHAGVSRVVVAMTDPNPQVRGQGLARLAAMGIAVHSGVLSTQAEALNPGFVSRMSRARPWVRLKSATSLDGRTAMASGESQWITGEAARRDVQLLRARSAAIMTGSATVLSDDPALTVRLSARELDIRGEVRQPLRVVLDSRLRTPPQAKILRLPGRCLILTAAPKPARAAALEAAGAEVCRVATGEGGVDLDAVLRELAAREINELHVEAGATLAGALLEQGLVDELVIYMAPHLMGDRARALARLPRVGRMEQRMGMSIQDIRRVGEDLRITVLPVA